MLSVSVDDAQTGGCNGIHLSRLADLDPTLYGINTIITPDDEPTLAWVDDRHTDTGLNVPELVHNTMLYLLLYPDPLIVAGTAHVKIEQTFLEKTARRDHNFGRRIAEQLGLTLYINPNMIGDIHSNDEDTIYHGTEFACRTSEALARVQSVIPVVANRPAHSSGRAKRDPTSTAQR